MEETKKIISDILKCNISVSEIVYNNAELAEKEIKHQAERIAGMERGLKDIGARVKEIKYYHTKPTKPIQGKITSICVDVESRIDLALKEVDK